VHFAALPGGAENLRSRADGRQLSLNCLRSYTTRWDTIGVHPDPAKAGGNWGHLCPELPPMLSKLLIDKTKPQVKIQRLSDGRGMYSKSIRAAEMVAIQVPVRREYARSLFSKKYNF
jgi:hypothetical protein